MSFENSLFYHYWGKAKPSDDGPNCHLFPFHCLDVAKVANAWWNQSVVIRSRFIKSSNLPEEQIKAWVLFFIAAHDYGKLDIRFQLKALNVLTELFPEFDEEMVEPEAYYHGPSGYEWFRDDSMEFGLTDSDLDKWLPWIYAVAGHHGDMKSASVEIGLYADEDIIRRDQQARQQWLIALEELFLKPADLSLNSLPPAYNDSLAGFCSVSDWLGSNNEIFNYCDDKQISLEDYWQQIGKNSNQTIIDSGLVGSVIALGGMKQLFPEYTPREIQTLVDQFPISQGLALIEAPTGSGKTEAALAYASRLLVKDIAESIIFALPTQATANAMLDRLIECGEKIFGEGANLILAHGKARFNKNYQSLKSAADEKTVQQDEDASVQCIQWLAASRKRVFLGQIGVCTVDQVLMSVLPIRHQFVRGFGLRKSILIIDEVHAYDAYMYGLLGQVLNGQQKNGGSAILLSATLPYAQKRELVRYWQGDVSNKDLKIDESYPLVTLIDHENCIRPFKMPKEYKPDSRSVFIDIDRDVNFLPSKLLLKGIVNAVNSGALVAVVCNLVADAQLIADKLSESLGECVDLFHARFLFKDRDKIEKQILKYYGKKFKYRKKGRVLVATQVIEQSLDLDFDWLISQLCPVDLLFQRLGRLHRHKRGIEQRPEGFRQAKCTVILPVNEGYQLHELIYGSQRVLWRTQQLLEQTVEQSKPIEFPEAYRDWIEKVYQEDSWENEPQKVVDSYEKFIVDNEARRYCATKLANSDAIPLPDTEGAAAALTRDGDMACNVILLQETKDGIAFLNGSLLADYNEYDLDEQLNLNTVGVPVSWKQYLPTEDDVGCHRLALSQQADSYSAVYKNQCFTYSMKKGLEKKEL